MRRRIAFLLGSGLALGAAAPAAAAEVQVRGLDSLVWDKPEVTVAIGDTVTWTFEPNELHNLAATSPNWGHRVPTGKPPAPSSFQFTAEGIYTYVCELHSGTMKGTVTVGSPPPPPPPPLSEQPLPNDSAISVGALETGGLDTVRPALRGVSVRKPRGSVRVSFRVSEQSMVSVRFLRRGRTVKTKKARVARRGAVSVGGLEPGRYAVRIRAVDVAGNPSRVRRARVTLR